MWLEHIQTLLRWIDSTDTIHQSYKIENGGFVHLHYGGKTQRVKRDWTEDELKGIFDITATIYANQMRVNPRLVKNAFPSFNRQDSDFLNR